MGCSTQKQVPQPAQTQVQTPISNTQLLTNQEKKIEKVLQEIQQYEQENKLSLVEIKRVELKQLQTQRNKMINQTKVNVIVKTQMENAQMQQTQAMQRVEVQDKIIGDNEKMLIVQEKELDNVNRILDQNNEIEQNQKQIEDAYLQDCGDDQNSQIRQSVEQINQGQSARLSTQAKISKTTSIYEKTQKNSQGQVSQQRKQLQYEQ